MIRKLTEQDRAIFLDLMDEFYHSPAVLHPVPEKHYERIFQEIIREGPYAAGFLLEKDGCAAGYGQISFTYSTEAGGLVALLEELYIRPAFQGQGLGQAYFSYVNALYAGKVARFRLEVEPDNEGALRLYRRLGYTELPYLQMCREFEV